TGSDAEGATGSNAGSEPVRSAAVAGVQKGHETAATCLAISTRAVTSGEVALARRHGIRLMDYPVWQYRWLAPPPHLTATILAEEPQAWVFTSRRGVEGWWRTWKEQLRKQKLRNEILGKTTQQGQGHQMPGKTTQQTQGHEMPGKTTQQAQGRDGSDAMRIPPVYVVGGATADAVRRFFGDAGIREAGTGEEEIRQDDVGEAGIGEAGVTQADIGEADIRVADRGDGKSLGEALLRDGVQHAVHFCAVERRTELAEFCMKHGISLTEAEVYQRTAVSNRKPLFTAFDALLFFSPDGVTEFFRVYGVPGGSWRPVAVGQTTAAAIRQETGRDPLIAASPSFEEMLKLV
ncbi:MAG: uroporphyrinogen-III synthase, partial [Balneolaceae bacterium]